MNVIVAEQADRFVPYEKLAAVVDRLTKKLLHPTILVPCESAGMSAICDYAFRKKWLVRRYYPSLQGYSDGRKRKQRSAAYEKALRKRDDDLLSDAGPRAAMVAFWDGKDAAMKALVTRAREKGIDVRSIIL